MVNWWKNMENYGKLWKLEIEVETDGKLGDWVKFEDHHDFSKKAQSFPQQIWRNKEWKWVIHRRNLSNNLASPIWIAAWSICSNALTNRESLGNLAAGGFSCLLSGMETRRNGNDSITTMLVEPYCGACFGTCPSESCMVGFCQRVMVERTLQVGKAISASLCIYISK